MCDVSCGFRFRPTLGLKQCNSQNLSANMATSQNLPANEAAGHSLVNGNKRKNYGVQKTMVHCGPHALEVTNLNAVASNLMSTCFKS